MSFWCWNYWENVHLEDVAGNLSDGKMRWIVSNCLNLIYLMSERWTRKNYWKWGNERLWKNHPRLEDWYQMKFFDYTGQDHRQEQRLISTKKKGARTFIAKNGGRRDFFDKKRDRRLFFRWIFPKTRPVCISIDGIDIFTNLSFFYWQSIQISIEEEGAISRT